MALKQRHILLLLLCNFLTALSLSANDLTDPTRPITTADTTAKAAIKKKSPPKKVLRVHPGWTLESTLVAHDRQVAVINGKLVSEGDSVDGARVLRIRNLDVLVQTSSKRITLHLLPDIVKKIP